MLNKTLFTFSHPPRLQQLNFLRFLAAAMVGVFHCAFIFSPESPFMDLLILGSDGVYVFFVISGFIIPWSLDQSHYSTDHWSIFMIKRFRRLFPPFVFSLLCYWIGWWWLHPYNAWESIQLLLSNLFFLVPFGVGEWVNEIYWTLWVELQFYLLVGFIFPILIHLFPSRSSGIILLLNLLCFGSMLIPEGTEKNFILFHLPYFTMGFIAFQIARIRAIQMGHVLSLFFTLLTLWWSLEGLHGLPLSSLYFSIFTFVFILFFNTTFKFLEWIGEFSYSFYLMHGLIIAWVSLLWNQFNSLAISPWAFLLLVQVLAWVFSAILYQGIEKKSLLWSKKIKYPYATNITRSR